MTTPLVSIVIPTYDRPEMFGLALRSALEQTYEHLDVFIADDGTNPETEAVFREVAAGDLRARFERNATNLGNYGNGIRVLRAARGEYLKMLLDDDLLAPTHVETLVAPLVDDPTLTLAFSKRTIIDEHGIAQPDPPGMGALAQVPGRIPAEQLAHLCCSMLMNWIGEQTTTLYRRSSIDMARPVRFAGGVPSAVLGDLAMWLALLARGDAWYTPEPLSSFRQHGGQVSHRPDVHLESLADWVMLQERLHLAVETPAVPERLTTHARLIAALASRLADTPDLPAAGAAQMALERAVRNFRSLREHGRIIDAPRVSIALAAGDDAPALLRQLESIIATTPEDAFEVVIVASDPPDAVRSLLDSLDGDVQVIDAELGEGVEAAARRVARHVELVVLDADAQLVRGWVAAYFDARSE